MGLPNTGKTSTSLAVSRALAGRYLAEDIAFVRLADGAVFGGPFTLDEQKAQNQAELRAAQFVGAPAAISFGPVMRFVTGSLYAAPAVARHVLAQRQPRVAWSF